MHEFLSPIDWLQSEFFVGEIDVVLAALSQDLKTLTDESARWKWIMSLAVTLDPNFQSPLTSALVGLAILENQLDMVGLIRKLDATSHELLLRGLYFIGQLHERNQAQILSETRNGFGYLKFKQSSFVDVVTIAIQIKKLQQVGIIPEGPIVDLGCGNALTLLTMALCSHSNLVGLEKEAALVRLAHANREAFSRNSRADWQDIRFIQECFYSEKADNVPEVQQVLAAAAVMYVYAYKEEFEERIRLFEHHAQPRAVLVIYMHTVDLMKAQNRWYHELKTRGQHQGLVLLRSSNYGDKLKVDQTLPENDSSGNAAMMADMSMGRSCIIVQKV